MTLKGNKLQIAFIGCVESSLLALTTLIDMDCVEICAVITRSDSKVNSDFVDLSPVCKANDIPYLFEDPHAREATLDFLCEYNIDVIYCFGWSYLLKQEILEIAPHGVIGFHPAKLPMNRGRHPIIWALALGLEETASTFFKMDEGADSGPIISQKLVTIDTSDDATSLYNKILHVANEQIKDFTKALYAGNAQFIEQNAEQATYWRKRSRKDGLIDWRMSATSIHNLIRALAPPYPGAEFMLDEKLYVVSSSTLSLNSCADNVEPGKVISTIDNSLLIKCAGTDAIWLHEIDATIIENIGEYL
jgi:methionyl-tRNA formyltransferase